MEFQSPRFLGRRILPLLALLFVLLSSGGSLAAAPTAPRQICGTVGNQPSGALYQICMPIIGWNGELVLYAHGYVAPNLPLAIPEEASLLGNTLNLLGYGFAVTSYRQNGLAVVPGEADLLELVDLFTDAEGAPSRTYLIGVSEGGLITTLSVERHADVYDGGLALCGPIGNFHDNLNDLGDFRLLFDYFFPGLMPGDPLDIPQWLIDDWDTYFSSTIEPVITDPAQTDALEQLLRTARAPESLADSVTTVENALRFNVMATNDSQAQLGGSAYDNSDRIYSGSDDDAALNAAIPRYTADPAALGAIAAYQSSGSLSVPLVTRHTTADPIVSPRQQVMYRGSVLLNDNLALHDMAWSDRYGHCNFTTDELLASFNLLVDRVENPAPYRPVQHAFLPIIRQP